MPSLLFLGLSLLLLSACQPKTYLNQNASAKPMLVIDSSLTPDAETQALIRPYRDSLEADMRQVLGYCPQTLEKQQPDGNLNQWMAEALQRQALKAFRETPPDFTLVNYGGLRIPQIGQGPITKGRIYELAPFDNFLVLVEMPAEEMPKLWAHVLQKGGWPLSPEVHLKYHENELLSWQLNYKTPQKPVYYIATNDYLANGGDNCQFFVGKKQYQTGLVLRQALIQDLLEQGQAQTQAIQRYFPK